jgi:small subunit ribosomal protein S20
MVRTYMKRVNAALIAQDATAAGTALNDTLPLLDRMVSKGIMHKSKAARHKSRLSKQVHQLG